MGSAINLWYNDHKWDRCYYWIGYWIYCDFTGVIISFDILRNLIKLITQFFIKSFLGLNFLSVPDQHFEQKKESDKAKVVRPIRVPIFDNFKKSRYIRK